MCCKANPFYHKTITSNLNIVHMSVTLSTSNMLNNLIYYNNIIPYLEDAWHERCIFMDMHVTLCIRCSDMNISINADMHQICVSGHVSFKDLCPFMTYMHVRLKHIFMFVYDIYACTSMTYRHVRLWHICMYFYDIDAG